MRVDVKPILDNAKRLLRLIEQKDRLTAASVAKTFLDFLPPDNFADPAPGLTVCYSRQEWDFRTILPFLRGSTTKWLKWLQAPTWLRWLRTFGRGWPEPQTLRAAVAALEGIAASMEATESQSTVDDACLEWDKRERID